MFGNNTPVSKQAFKDMPTDSLGTVSRFYTLQGEGPYSGKSAVFVRLAKCNLTCTFCDTYFDAMPTYTFDDLYAEILQCIKTWQKQNNAVQDLNWISKNVGLVITGVQDSLGRVLDFSIIKEKLCVWLEYNWDHKFLLWEQDPAGEFFKQKDPDGLALVPFNPTAENMAQYLVETIAPKQLADSTATLTHITIEETRKCSASYTKA